MRKFLFALFILISIFDAIGVNRNVVNSFKNFHNGEFIMAYHLISGHRNMKDETGDYVYGDVDMAICNYYEFLNEQLLFEPVRDKATKIAFNARVFGSDHYITLTMKALQYQHTPEGLIYCNKAIEAIEDELGNDCWQYFLMKYFTVATFCYNGLYDDGLRYAQDVKKEISKSSFKASWIDTGISISQTTIYIILNQPEYTIALLPSIDYYDVAPHITDLNHHINLFTAISTLYDMIRVGSAQHFNNYHLSHSIDNANLKYLYAGGYWNHIGFYATQMFLTLGAYNETIEVCNLILDNCKKGDIMNGILADSIRATIAFCEWYGNKNIKKARAVLEELLKKYEKNKADFHLYDNVLYAYNQLTK